MSILEKHHAPFLQETINTTFLDFLLLRILVHKVDSIPQLFRQYLIGFEDTNRADRVYQEEQHCQQVTTIDVRLQF